MSHLHLYLIEAALLALFMLSACTWVAILQHPASPVACRIPHPFVRRALIGLAMGATAVLLITSPWGRLSGAHMNPAVTLAFTILGKVEPVDAMCYIVFQLLGGLAGMLLARIILGPALAHPAVNFIITEPRSHPGAREHAFGAEFLISFFLLSTVLILANSPVTMAFTPFAAGTLVCLYITFEAPISGMSMNPARTLASAVAARRFSHLPIYFTAPPLGMAAAAFLYSGLLGSQAVHCAKLDHAGHAPCPFHCTIDALRHPHHDDGIQPVASADGAASIPRRSQ